MYLGEREDLQGKFEQWRFYPPDTGMWVKFFCFFPECVSRLNGNNLVPLTGQPGSIPAGARTDIKDQRLNRRYKVQPCMMNLFGQEAFIFFRDLFSVFGIIFNH